jgi:hydroxyethylthiazole kinase
MPQATDKKTLNDLFADLTQIRKTNPVIHNISNLVVMPITANVLLALGASPIMAHAKEELAEILQLANALVINIGTPDENWLSSIALAQNLALEKKIPIVFDPVGAGASQYRTQAAKKILSQGVHVIRGNASEIMSLEDDHIQTKGVDSLQCSEDALLSAMQLAKKYHCIVVVSGKRDLVVDGEHALMLDYGSSLFTKVVGMGCSLTAWIASFLTVNTNIFIACKHAMILFGLLGELAAQQSTGPGSFYIQLLDRLYKLQRADLETMLSAHPIENFPQHRKNCRAQFGQEIILDT